jgi:hypothetical protein
MKLLIVSIFFFGLLYIDVRAQIQTEEEIANRYIQAEDLKKHLSVLASDEYLGRETGKEGQKLAASYISNVFKETGAEFVPGMNGYEQYFDVIETQADGDLNLLSSPLQFKKDFIYLNCKKKLELSNVPMYTILGALKTNCSSDIIIVDTVTDILIRDRITFLREKGMPKNTRAVVLFVQNYDLMFSYFEHYVTDKTMRLAVQEAKNELPIILVDASRIGALLPKNFRYLSENRKFKKRKTLSKMGEISISLNKSDLNLTSSNILAYIPGNDPILKNEMVVITAHYDHIGVEEGVVFNGADDDGTGTVGLLELAEAFVQLKRFGEGTKRSILIMPVSGEEKGLLGSDYFTQFPTVPLSSIIADLNIDMIGRDDISHENDTAEYIYIIGSNMLSYDLHNANESANQSYTKLELDYTFNSKDDPNKFYYRSDHYNFAKNNIPSIFYFSGIHEDYHQPTDDIEKIDFQKVERVTKLVYYTAIQLANNEDRPKLNK